MRVNLKHYVESSILNRLHFKICFPLKKELSYVTLLQILQRYIMPVLALAAGSSLVYFSSSLFLFLYLYEVVCFD